jgi:hypothetical protein
MPDENPPAELLTFLARQLGLSASAWASYAERDETRREHLAELQIHYGLRSFGIGQYRSLATWLMPTALQTNRGVVLVRAGIDELRRRSVIVPRLAVLERLCAEVLVRSERQLFQILTADLSDRQRLELDTLLKLRGSSKVSTTLGRLRDGSGRARSGRYGPLQPQTSDLNSYRGRDAHCCAPPAQIPAGVIHAPGSHLGCLTAKRTLGQG